MGGCESRCNSCERGVQTNKSQGESTKKQPNRQPPPGRKSRQSGVAPPPEDADEASNRRDTVRMLITEVWLHADEQPVVTHKQFLAVTGAEYEKRDIFSKLVQGHFTAGGSRILATRKQVTDFLIADNVTRLAKVQMAEFGRPLGCSGVTVVAMAMSSLGEATTVNDVFHSAQLCCGLIAEAEMTLAHTYIVAEAVAAQHKSLFVECYHMDANAPTFADFCYAIYEAVVMPDNVLVFNLERRDGRKRKSKRGLFAVLSGMDTKKGDVFIVDVQGKSWKVGAKNLYESLVATDGASKRARGMLRICSQRALRGLSKLTQTSVSCCDARVGEEQRLWLRRFALLPPDCFTNALDTSGAEALALAFTGLMQDGAADAALGGNITTGKEVVLAVKADYTQLLQCSMDPEQLTTMAKSYIEHSQLLLAANTMPLDLTSDDSLAECLASQISAGSVVLLRFDLNVAAGISLLSNSETHWSIAIGQEEGYVVLADPEAVTMTRLWRSRIGNLRKALATNLKGGEVQQAVYLEPVLRLSEDDEARACSVCE